ncbi:MAG: VanW family protein [Anaerolineae bacterium]|nr:VanW family protein [Anaerolineae bacterium]
MTSWNQQAAFDDTYDDGPGLFSQLWLGRMTLIAVSIIILVNLIAALCVAGYQIYYDGAIFPGVNVWGVELGGMTPAEAAVTLQGQFTYPQSATITFRDDEDIWRLTAGELGVHFDVERTVQAAYDAGRRPSLIESLREQAVAWRQGVVMSPVVVFDQQIADGYLQRIAAQTNCPPVNATVRVENLQAATTPSQIGRQVDIPGTMEALGQLIARLESGEVEVVVTETPPAIADADEAARTINTILGSDLEIFVENAATGDPGPWIASRESLAEMLVIESANSSYTVRLDETKLQDFLEPLDEKLVRDPVNAHFIFNDETKQLELLASSVQGRTLNIPATVQNINHLIIDEKTRKIPLVFDVVEPDVPETATAAELGITQLVSSATTYFPGSSESRKNNVRTAASRFHGVVVKPGDEFSFVYYLGDVSSETGYDEAWIIFNGRTIKGVGGGVCQVSTTAFQAAFYAGFPITQRVPHGYRVGYYERGEGSGMDATVFAPEVDMRFINDTPYHLLIETYTDTKNNTLTFKFYSTSDGRTVQKDGPYVTNIVAHGPAVYEENPELAPGTVKQVDFAVDGADVKVVRIVYRDGQVISRDTFLSHYLPWQAVYQVAPGHTPAPAAEPATN